MKNLLALILAVALTGTASAEICEHHPVRVGSVVRIGSPIVRTHCTSIGGLRIIIGPARDYSAYDYGYDSRRIAEQDAERARREYRDAVIALERAQDRLEYARDALNARISGSTSGR